MDLVHDPGNKATATVDVIEKTEKNDEYILHVFSYMSAPKAFVEEQNFLLRQVWRMVHVESKRSNAPSLGTKEPHGEGTEQEGTEASNGEETKRKDPKKQEASNGEYKATDDGATGALNKTDASSDGKDKDMNGQGASDGEDNTWRC